MSLLRHIFGLVRPRRRSSVWLPPGYDPTHYLWLASPGYVYADTAGTVLLTAAGNARSWRARNGTLAVSNAPVAWDGVDKFTHTGAQYWDAAIGSRSMPETVVAVAQRATGVVGRHLINSRTANTMTVYQTSTSIVVVAGVSLSLTADISGRGVACAVFAGASSVIRWNGAENSGNAGTTTATDLRIGGSGGAMDEHWRGTISAIYLIPATAADATRRAALEASFMSYFNIGLSITAHPALTSYVFEGDTVTLSVTATGSQPITYQWYSGTSGDMSSPISGATSASYTTPALTANASYWCRVAFQGASSGLASTTAVVTVFQVGVPPIAPVNWWEMTTSGTLYQDAAGTIPALSGDPVRVIGDLGSQGVPATAPSDAARGVLGASGVVFSGAQSYAAAIGSIAPPETIYIVHGGKRTSGGQNLVDGASPIYGTRRITLQTGVYLVTNNATYIYDNRINETLAAIICAVLVAPDGLSVLANNDIEATGVLNSTAGSGMTIGRGGGGGGEFNGPIATVLRYTTAHDATQRATMRAWLSIEHNLNLAITAHPTLLAYSGMPLSVAATGNYPIAYQWYQGLPGDTATPVSGATSAAFTAPTVSSPTDYWCRVSYEGSSQGLASTAVTVYATFDALLVANSTYAWFGDNGLADDGVWTDRVSGVVATSAARPTIGEVNGRRAASFDGTNDRLVGTFSATITQPYAMIAVVRLSGSGPPASSQYVCDGIAVGSRCILYYTASGRLYLSAPNDVYITLGALQNAPLVIAATVNGAASSLSVNGGALSATGNAGAHTLTGVTIGSAYSQSTTFLSGLMGGIIVVSGANYAARAAAIATAARAWYGI